jgi:hypothetical protein
MKRSVVLVLLLVTTPAYAWQPPSGGPSKMAKRVLDSLAEPTKVAIPHDIEERSRSGYVPQVPVEGIDQITTSRPGCWQVQLTVVSDSDRASVLARQESSRLGVPVVVVVESGSSKVRAGDCLDEAAARTLRDRVRDLGYPGAFIVKQQGGNL